METTIGSRTMLRLLVALFLSILASATLAGPALAANITVNTTEDETNFDADCSLREAIFAANTDAAAGACPAGSGADTITVPAGTYTLDIGGAGEDATMTGDLDVTGDTIITGAGARETIVQGGAAFDDRIFDNTGTTEISGLTITGGNAGSTADGGGVRNTGSDLTLDGVSVSDNNAADDGGGIAGEWSTLDVIDSTVSGNEAGGGTGGGVYQESGIANIKNSTISGNRAAGNGGVTATFNTFMNIRSSTIANNTSSGLGGGIITSVFSDTTVKNSIVSANTPTNCFTETGSATASLGFNIERADSCGFDKPTDLPITDPMLEPLSDNGGPTDTHALGIGSQAIDAGDSDQAEDQRGVSRPQDGDNNAGIVADDIGAYEQEPDAAPEITPLSPDPDASISDRTPTIKAKVLDPETDLVKADIKLFLDDGRRRGFSYDTTRDRLSFTTARLSRTSHTVDVEATDGRNISFESWSFTIR